MNQSEYRYRETHWRYCSLTLIHRNEYVNSPAALVFDLSCLIGSLFGLTSNLCNATPLCGESTGDWLIPLRQRLKSSMIWDAMTLKWRHCIMRSRVCMYTYRYTDTEIEGRTMSKLKSIISSSCTEFNCWGANATGWHHYINLHGDNSHRAKRINVKTF